MLDAAALSTNDCDKPSSDFKSPKNFKDLDLIDYSELKPTRCTWADTNEKMKSDKGHNIPQSKCFTKYLEDKNYLISYLENILK